MADPKLMGHFIAIRSLLEPDEAAQIFALGDRVSADEQEWLIGQLGELGPAEAAALLRKVLVELRASTDSAQLSQGNRKDHLCRTHSNPN